MYMLNNRPPKCIKQKWKELKGEIDSSVILVGDCNSFLSIVCTKTRQKISEEVENLNNTTYKLDISIINRTLYLSTRKYTFFSSTRDFFRKDYMLGHKISFNR